ncbi:MAG TPA: hypothetical protein VKB26_01210 [Candidatus Acidoferrales bacterium]|nr:hypothetical protein [Candidatus Acidoferrales bacterium]
MRSREFPASGWLIEVELLTAAIVGGVVEAAGSGTGVVEVAAFEDAFVSFFVVPLSWVFLPDAGPLCALTTRGASIAAAATQTQSHRFIRGPLFGWKKCGSPVPPVR